MSLVQSALRRPFTVLVLVVTIGLGAVVAALGASLACTQAAGLEKRNGASATLAEDQDADQPAEKDTTRQHRAKVKALAKEEEKEGKTVAWLGLGVEEASEALAAQLDLKDGEGLVVTFVASESPAAKAGFQKNDVLTRLDDQLLVFTLRDSEPWVEAWRTKTGQFRVIQRIT